MLRLPLGIRREDQTSCAPQSGVRGGQLMTGYAVFPDITGPRPLLLPATATNTVGTPSPEEKQMHIMKWQIKKSSPQKIKRLLKMNTHLHILLWCGVSHLDLCVPRWLSGCRESHRRYRPSWSFHSEPSLRWSPSEPPPCRWPGAPTAARDTIRQSVGSQLRISKSSMD